MMIKDYKFKTKICNSNQSIEYSNLESNPGQAPSNFYCLFICVKLIGSKLESREIFFLQRLIG